MKIVFFGTAEFALPTLEKLALSEHCICVVVTQPDRKKGRHLELSPPPIKILANKLNLATLQPQRLNQPELVAYLKSLEPDLFVVVSYGRIFKKEFLDIPRFCAINLHASVLPKYRGAAPINWAILRGEDITGVTIIRMNEKMDAGDILLQKQIPILEGDTSISLSDKLSHEGADLVLEAIHLIQQGKAKFYAQDERQVSFAPSLKKEDGRVDWRRSAEFIHNQVRALQPWPTTFCFLRGRLLKLWKTKVEKTKQIGRPGEVLEMGWRGLVVATGENNLLIEELQLEGGRRLSVEKFLLGHKIEKGEFLE